MQFAIKSVGLIANDCSEHSGNVDTTDNVTIKEKEDSTTVSAINCSEQLRNVDTTDNVVIEENEEKDLEEVTTCIPEEKISSQCCDRWTWWQSYSNFPFLFFTTCEPVLSTMSLHDRTDVDCVVVWNVHMDGLCVGKAYFFPYGVPDMVGEAGIAVFHDQGHNFKGDIFFLFFLLRFKHTSTHITNFMD